VHIQTKKGDSKTTQKAKGNQANPQQKNTKSEKQNTNSSKASNI
jgi:hypothetical protein